MFKCIEDANNPDLIAAYESLKRSDETSGNRLLRARLREVLEAKLGLVTSISPRWDEWWEDHKSDSTALEGTKQISAEFLNAVTFSEAERKVLAAVGG